MTAGLLLGFSCAEWPSWPSDPLSWVVPFLCLMEVIIFLFCSWYVFLLIPFSLHCFVLYGHRYSKADIVSAKGKSCLDHEFSLCDSKVILAIIIGSFLCRGLCQG